MEPICDGNEVKSPFAPPVRATTLPFEAVTAFDSTPAAVLPDADAAATDAGAHAAAVPGNLTPSRRPTGVHKPRPEPLDLPPIADTSAYVVPEEEQEQQRQQQHLPPLEPSGSGASGHAAPADNTHDVPALTTNEENGTSHPASTTSNGLNRPFHHAHKKASRTRIDMWFDYMIALSEVVFVCKLNLYEEACAGLLAIAAPRRGRKSSEGLIRSERAALDILDRMQFRRPVKVRKQVGLIDAIEEEKEYVYEGLEEGYKVFDVDVDAVRHYGERNGWLLSHPSSRHRTPLLAPNPALSGAAITAKSQGKAPLDDPCSEASPTGATAGSPSEASPLSSSSAPDSADDETGETAEDVIEHTLLYGELTSAGVRQVVHLFHEAVSQDTADDPYSQDYGSVVVGVDIGCGTGKMLFEWSRLATAQVQLDNSEKSPTPTDGNAPNVFPLSVLGAASTSEVPTALQYTRMGSWRGAVAGQALGGSPATSLNTRRQQHYISRMPADLAPPENWSFSSLGAAGAPPVPVPTKPRSNMRGFLGIGIEVAPSRVFVARKAMSPNYLDLVLSRPKRSSIEECSPLDTEKRPDSTFAGPRQTFAFGDVDSAEEAKKLMRHPVSALSTRSSMPRYDPAPASAVAAPCPDPSKRRPAACVLLHEGDVLSPGLLHNQTLFRFPAPGLLYNPNMAPTRTTACGLAAPLDSGSFGGALSLGGMAAGLPGAVRATHGPARENYYRLCRVQRGPTPSGHEVPHLNLFCCGIGFDEHFVRALCTAIEGLLQPLPPDEPHTTTTTAEVIPGAHDLTHTRAGGVNDDAGPMSISRTMLPSTTASSVTGLDKVNVMFPKLLRPSALEHWKSITCILLLRDFDVEETLKQPDFPLFNCCRRWHVSTRRTGTTETTTSGERSAASTPAPQFASGGSGDNNLIGMPEGFGEYEDRSINVPNWCTARATLRDSSVRLTHVETTWMTKAPAWVLNFRF